MENVAKGKNRRPKRLPAEIQAMVDGGRLFYSIASKLVTAVYAAGGTAESIRRLDTPNFNPVFRELAELIVAECPPTTVPAEKPVVVQPVAIPVAVAPPTIDISDFFTPLTDDAVVAALVKKYSAADAATLVANFRKMALEETGFSGPSIAWRVKAGFTLKQHAAKSGPCHNDFQYLQPWNFPDEPTKSGIVLGIPRLVNGSTNKTVTEQLEFLVSLRQKYTLPDHHLSGFGNVALLAGLILAHHKATGEMIPLDNYWARTDTRYAGGFRLGLVWSGGRLDCDDCSWDEGWHSDVGVVALGVELGS